MITFDLACERGHRFEGWFRNREDYDAQSSRGMITCPLCGSSEVEKQLSAVSVHVSRRTGQTGPQAGAQGGKPAAPAAVDPGAAAGGSGSRLPGKPFFQAMAEFIETHFEDVGANFAAEARSIHLGEAEARNIRGVTTPEEEESLRDEGVEFQKIPIPKYDG